MESKENYPFIYFLMESNTVFVYKIKTHNYLNASDLIDYSEWEAYELRIRLYLRSSIMEKVNQLRGGSIWNTMKYTTW